MVNDSRSAAVTSSGKVVVRAGGACSAQAVATNGGAPVAFLDLVLAGDDNGSRTLVQHDPCTSVHEAELRLQHASCLEEMNATELLQAMQGGILGVDANGVNDKVRMQLQELHEQRRKAQRCMLDVVATMWAQLRAFGAPPTTLVAPMPELEQHQVQRLRQLHDDGGFNVQLVNAAEFNDSLAQQRTAIVQEPMQLSANRPFEMQPKSSSPSVASIAKPVLKNEQALDQMMELGKDLQKWRNYVKTLENQFNDSVRSLQTQGVLSTKAGVESLTKNIEEIEQKSLKFVQAHNRMLAALGAPSVPDGVSRDVDVEYEAFVMHARALATAQTNVRDYRAFLEAFDAPMGPRPTSVLVHSQENFLYTTVEADNDSETDATELLETVKTQMDSILGFVIQFIPENPTENTSAPLQNTKKIWKYRMQNTKSVNELMDRLFALLRGNDEYFTVRHHHGVEVVAKKDGRWLEHVYITGLLTVQEERIEKLQPSVCKFLNRQLLKTSLQPSPPDVVQRLLELDTRAGGVREALLEAYTGRIMLELVPCLQMLENASAGILQPVESSNKRCRFGASAAIDCGFDHLTPKSPCCYHFLKDIPEDANVQPAELARLQRGVEHRFAHRSFGIANDLANSLLAHTAARGVAGLAASRGVLAVTHTANCMLEMLVEETAAAFAKCEPVHFMELENGGRVCLCARDQAEYDELVGSAAHVRALDAAIKPRDSAALNAVVDLD